MEKSLLGIFDSGVGGFSVLKETRKVTDADIIYFGDCARAPYGNRSEEEIILFIKEILLNLKDKGATHFISACNSMSVHTTQKVLEEAGIAIGRYIDMVASVQKILFPVTAKVLIVGTKATIDSEVYQGILRGNEIMLDVFAPQGLAGNIEKDDSSAIKADIKDILAHAKKVQASHILYACTHYPLVDGLFKEEAVRIGWRGEFVDPALSLAQEMKKWKVSGTRQLTLETSLETPVFKDYSARAW